MAIEIIIADYSNKQQGLDIVLLMDAYSSDPMGGNKSLPSHVKENLVSELAKIPHAVSIICYVDQKPAGLINCFEGFSSFKCRPLLNVHDVFVLANFRGLGISQLMLNTVEDIARSKNCCKITLEVLEGNSAAQAAYLKQGFTGYELDPAMGKALFWEKVL